ncbi:hypothetical protein [Clostridium gasigenes]|uniref:Uncharacterized protein n=1 Tax=Clostridium gasigenes TaxID=94869 RepID=A0A1H0N4B8_9CLOT|nr:hypothetical protein [Clostridium gasigenes]MBB6716250.1 hypothetical protein [Clostridium gasigenes]SDO87528.1 hypothetical protein SAMN04488529_101684 [Clostridium gasigenes]
MDKWMYSLTDSEVWQGEEFNTKEEAITEGRKEAIRGQEEEFRNDYFSVGQIEKVFPSGVDVENILENVAENTRADICEVGDDYLYDVTENHSQELEEKLNEVLFEWMKKYEYEPTFYAIKNIEQIEL